MKRLEDILNLRVDCDSSSKLKISRFSRKKEYKIKYLEKKYG